MSSDLIAVVLGLIAGGIGLLMLLRPGLARSLESHSLTSSLESTWFLTKEQVEDARVQAESGRSGKAYAFVPVFALVWRIAFVAFGLYGLLS